VKLLWHLADSQLADAGSNEIPPAPRRLCLTATGWTRVDELRPTGARGNTAFVAMSFGDQLKSVFEEGMQPALDACDYAAYRVDLDQFSEKIDDRIVAQIRRAALVIVECTGQRPNVYFEAGFALGLGVPLIWCCRDSDVSTLHFDVRQYPCIFWKDASDLRERLKARIEALYPRSRTH
jgi:hypothetical protein